MNSIFPLQVLGLTVRLVPPIWNLDMSEDGPLQFKVNQLVNFCFPGGIQESLQDQQNNLQTRALLTVDNVKHFLELFTNFQGHFPCLHMPTFDLIESYDGLILAIICIGAVYSHRVLEGQVRNLMQRTKCGIERTSSIFLQFGVGHGFTARYAVGYGVARASSASYVINTTHLARRLG